MFADVATMVCWGWFSVTHDVVEMTLLVSIIGLNLPARLVEIVTRFIILPTWVIHSHYARSHTFSLLAPPPRAIVPAEPDAVVMVSCRPIHPFCQQFLHCFPLGGSFHGNKVFILIKTRGTGLIPRDVSVIKGVADGTWEQVLNIKSFQVSSLSIFQHKK